MQCAGAQAVDGGISNTPTDQRPRAFRFCHTTLASAKFWPDLDFDQPSIAEVT